MRLTIIATLALGLAGCVNADTQLVASDYFTSYRAKVQTEIWRTIERGPYATAPGPVKVAYSECGADYVMSGFTADETKRLDDYAAHRSTMTVGEAEELDRRARERLGGELTYDTLDRLSSICPDAVPAFKQYFKPI